MTYIQICPSMSEFNAVKNKLARAVGAQYTPMYLKETNGDVQPSAVSEPSMLTNLESTTAAGIYAATPRPGVTGTLPVGNGGTGVTSNPSMLTNLGSTTAASVFAASPRPGVTGTLGAANGGTGQTSLQATRKAMGLGDTTGALPVANGGTGATTAAGARKSLGLGDSNGNFPITVAQGGTGKATHTNNAVLTGNTTSAVNNVATANGALYATAANGAAKFGTLPVAQGGTGVTSNPSMLTNLASTSAASVFAASPRPGVTGTLPMANGGTGATGVSYGSFGSVFTNIISGFDNQTTCSKWGSLVIVTAFFEIKGVAIAKSTKTKVAKVASGYVPNTAYSNVIVSGCYERTSNGTVESALITLDSGLTVSFGAAVNQNYTYQLTFLAVYHV